MNDSHEPHVSNRVARLVRLSLDFHNLNKSAESVLGLSLVQYHVLVILKDMPGCSPQALARSAGMHPSSLTQSIKRLSKRGQIFIGDDPKDSRKKRLSLTFSGNTALDKFESGIEALFDNKASALRPF